MTLSEIICGIITILGCIITAFVVPLLNTWKNLKLTQEQQSAIDYWTSIAVNWAKQTLGDRTGEDKKSAVINWLVVKSKELNWGLTEDDLDKIVEAIYVQIKSYDATIAAEVDNDAESV